MLTYQSERTNNWSFIVRQWLLTTILISTPVIIDLLFPQINLINASYTYIFIPIVSLAKLFWLSQEDRINEIYIDTDTKQIVFKIYNPYGGHKTEVLSFDNLRVKIDTSKLTWLFDPIAIYFLKNKTEIIKATKWKDGFSINTLDGLRKILDSITTPVTK